MSSYNDIANRIVGIITSPDSAVGAMTGVYSVAKDFGYLVRGYLDTESRYVRETEKIRMAHAVRYGVLQNKNLLKTIDTIISIFNKYTPAKFQDKIYSRTIFSVAGRAVTNSIISTKLASSISQNSSFLTKVRGGSIGNLLLIGGMMDHSIYISQSLERQNPEVYNALRHNNYDLLYFLVEPAVSPFVEALAVKNKQGQGAFEKILTIVSDIINKQGE